MYASTYGWIKMNILHRLRAFYTAFSFGQLWKASEPIDSRIWLLIAEFFFRIRDRSGSSFFLLLLSRSRIKLTSVRAVRIKNSPASAVRPSALGFRLERNRRYDVTRRRELLFTFARARPSKRGKILKRQCRCIGRSDVTESTVTTRSPFCGYNTT